MCLPAANIAVPLLDAEGHVHGTYRFSGSSGTLTLTYLHFAQTTELRVGSRALTLHGAAPVLVRALAPERSLQLWSAKKQHANKVNLGAYHNDFSDCEVAYSLSVPQTHVFFCGFLLHLGPQLAVSLQSPSAAVQLRPSASPRGAAGALPRDAAYVAYADVDDVPRLAVECSEFDQLVYGAELGSETVWVNDCERVVRVRERFHVQVGAATRSAPTNFPGERIAAAAPALGKPDAFFDAEAAAPFAKRRELETLWRAALNGERAAQAPAAPAQSALLRQLLELLQRARASKRHASV